jgi:hypothetical protein
MNDKGFYIVGGVLIVVGAYLYYAKKKENELIANPILGGKSVSVPPMEVPKSAEQIKEIEIDKTVQPIFERYVKLEKAFLKNTSGSFNNVLISQMKSLDLKLKGLGYKVENQNLIKL